MNQPHEFAEVIKAWADGKEIECNTSLNDADKWLPYDGKSGFMTESHGITFKYRIKPEPKYPETRMTKAEFLKASSEGVESGNPDTIEAAYQYVANAAIRRAIQDGDVVISEGKA